MQAFWMRNFLASTCAALLAAGCGSSTTESAFTPTRLLAFGDGFTDIGQTGRSYSINDGSANNWTLQIAAHYGLSLQPAATGGLSYAQGNARITATPDAAGDPTTPTLERQIDHFLASRQFEPGDLVLLGAGIADLVAGMARVSSGEHSTEQYLADARQAGEAMAGQVRRLSDSGALNIFVTGSYDLARTPWAKTIQQQELLSQASRNFNDGLLARIADLTQTVAFVDAAYYVNLFEGAAGGYGFSYVDSPACISIDAGQGIGIGAGEVNSALCTPDTLVPGADSERYLFADKIYLTPAAHRQFGNYVYDRLRVRW